MLDAYVEDHDLEFGCVCIVWPGQATLIAGPSSLGRHVGPSVPAVGLHRWPARAGLTAPPFLLGEPVPARHTKFLAFPVVIVVDSLLPLPSLLFLHLRPTRAKRLTPEQRSAAMDRVQLVLLGLPILLFCSDLVTLFAPQTPTAPKPDDRHHQPASDAFQRDDPSADDGASAQVAESQVDGPGYGTTTVELKFCASCSYRGTAMNMKRMLETSFPGIHVILENYPPPFPKRALSKAVPFLQVGAMATLMAGDQIFPRFGMVPPPWYYSLRANRFGTMATIWLFGNFAQSFLQSSGAFEVYCNGQLVFSKLSEQRFPGEFELRELIGNRWTDSQFGENLENVWS